MLVADKHKIRRRGLARLLALTVCTVSVAVSAMVSSPIKSEAAMPVSGDDISRTAVSYLGTPYVLGGTSRSGADCSGFVYAVLTELGFTNVPRGSAAWGSAPSMYYQGKAVTIQTLDASSPGYDAQPGDIIVYSGHLAFAMGQGSFEDIKNYVAALGGNTGLVFRDYSGWPVESPWYRIHARSGAANAEGRIHGVEVDNTNTGTHGSAYATVAYRIVGLESSSASGGNAEAGNNSSGSNSGGSSTPSGTDANSGGSSSAGAASITSMNISDLSSSGYTVTATLNNPSSASSISFPTWTDANGQDDITWESAGINGNTVTYRVNTSSHNGEGGNYTTHIHLRDRYGNLSIDGKGINVPGAGVSASATVDITNVWVSDVSSSGYTMNVTVTDASAVSAISFPTWTSANGQDDLVWGQAWADGNTYSYRVNTSEHGYEGGSYFTHIHLYDRSGRLTIDGREIWV